MNGVEKLPLGIRNNNPGNILWNSANHWRGEISGGGRYCRFKTMADGVRAAFKLMVNYHKLHACNTCFDFVFRFAPPPENDFKAYINDVSARNGWHDHYVLSIPQDIPRLLWAMFIHENGGEFITLKQVEDFTRPGLVV